MTAMEQSKWFTSGYLDHLKNAIEIWEYSLVNYRNLQNLGLDLPKIRYVPLQYMPCINHRENHVLNEKSIDFLFYGALNPYREESID